MMMPPPFEVGRHHNEKEARIVRQAIALLNFHVLCVFPFTETLVTYKCAATLHIASRS